MSAAEAMRFVQGLEGEYLATVVGRLSTDTAALLGQARADGFDVTAEDIRDAIVERYGEQLGPDELEALAAGSVVTSDGGGGGWGPGVGSP